MKRLTAELEKILTERFSKDSLISLATANDNMPYVRTVDAFYDKGSFYILTHVLSNKMKQLGINPNVAISGDWFTATGTGINLGYFCKAENKEIADKMRKYFSAWIDNGHNNFADENTVILQIKLKNGTIVINNEWINVDFSK